MSRSNAGPAWLAVAGRPVAHSISPSLHEAGLAALGRHGASVAFDVSAARFGALLGWLAEMDWTGLNVTAPHKEAACRLAARATEGARRAGSANCLRFGDAGVEATNTDGAALVAYLPEIEFAPRGRAIVLLGGGGAAAGLVPALADAGARLTAVTRRPVERARFPALAAVPREAWGTDGAARRLYQADLVIHATPLGRLPGEPLPCPPGALRPDAVALDLNYGPARTAWVTALAAEGRRAHDGLGMLLQQCALSFAHWFSETPPMARLREAVPWSVNQNPNAPR